MSNRKNELALKIEKLFVATYELLEEAEDLVKAPNRDTKALLENITGAQEGIKRLSHTMRELILDINKKNKDTKKEPVRFNIYDENFEDQISKAEKRSAKEFGGGHQRIFSFSPEGYPGGIDEILSLINQHISDNNDGDGGTFVGSK